MNFEVLVGKFNEDQSPVEVLLEHSEQIQNFISASPDPAKLEYYFGLAFPLSKSEGLLGFLYRKICDKSFDKVKEALFHIIQYVITQKAWRSEADRFYMGFKTTADMYWKHNKETARLQQVALDCLISLFSLRGSTLDLIEFDAKELYLELLRRSEKSLYQPTVRGKMFHLMGILGHLGHKDFMQQNDWFIQLFNHTISTVTAQVDSSDSHLEVSILHGCIKGLDNLLIVFNEEINVKDASWVKFQEQLHKIVDPSISIVKGDTKNVIKRREFQRAALELVAHHGELIQEGLFKKYRMWYEDLIEWAKSPNADDNKVGRRAINKFLDLVLVQYPNQFKANATEQQRRELNSLFKYFTEKFKSILGTKNANRIELSVAVRGFGMLSNLSTDQNKSLEMLDLIMLQIETIIHELDSPVVDKYNSSISIITTYLESVASILPSLKTEDSNTNKIPEHHLESIKKLTILLMRFYPDFSESQRQYAHISVQKTFDALWNHHHVLCEPFIEQTYQQSLLHIVSSPTKAEVDILIESWNKSNPEGKKSKSALSQLGLKSVKAYLKFWKLLLSRVESGSHELCFDLLMRWILDTVGKLDLSIKFDDSSENNVDLVQSASAAVVKDFQVFVNIVDFIHDVMSQEPVLHRKFQKWILPFCYETLEYIKTNTFVSGFYKILAVVFDAARSLRYFEEDNVEVRNLHGRLNVFLHSLGTKILEFRDDLLYSVLELWLSLPDTLILTNFIALNNTLKTIFLIGRTSFNLAIKGLEAVERWFFQKDFPVEQIVIIMNSIFPILKTFFISAEISSDEEVSLIEETASNKGNIKTLIKKNVQASRVNDEVTLKVIQYKILQLIGSFGQFVNLEENKHSGLLKDKRFLLYTVPFQDCKPELYIDDLLPRVLELCENAVERQTRVSACEFFHTVSLIFIGKSRETAKEYLFRQVFHHILKLGCDSDIVVRQLFNPLCLQTVHWFSKRNSPYGLALLNVLTENLTQNEDMNRRELAAVCFGEYFRWSLKHQSCTMDDHTAKDILKSIFAMGTHSSPTYRQGSVMAFNSIYRDFREETSLVSEFSFNLLFSFLTGLKLSKNMPYDSLLITSTRQAIKHLERILTKMKDRFNTALRRHFKPTATSTDTPCLKDVLCWLVRESGSDAVHYRTECLRLVEALCPVLKDVASVEKMLTVIEEKNSIDGWIAIAEGSWLDSKDAGINHSISFLDAASTFYTFLHKHKMLSKTLFSSKSRSIFWNKLLALCTSSEETFPQCSEDENLRLLQIFSRIRYAWNILDEKNLEQLWIYSIKLSKEITGVTGLDAMGSLGQVWCSGSFSASGRKKCASLLMFDPAKNVTSLTDDDLVDYLKASVWHRDVAECGFVSRVLSNDNAQELQKKIWDSIQISLFKALASGSIGSMVWEANRLSSNQRKLLENYLVIGLCLGLNEKDVLDAAFDSSGVAYMDGTFQLVSTKGHIFQKQLLNAIVYCKTFFQFDSLLNQMAIKEVGEFIQRLLSLVKSNKILRKQFGDRIFRQTLANWKMISNNCDVATTIKIFVGLLALNIDACRNSDELCRWWDRLMRAPHVDLRQKTEAFGYVTVFASSRRKKIIEAILKTILYVVETEFKTNQKWEDADQYVSHIFKKILKVFEQQPKNIEILEAVLTTLVKLSQWTQNLSNHALFKAARESLEKVVTCTCETDSERVDLVSNIYKLITLEENKARGYTETFSVWKCFLLPAVVALNLSSTKKFYKRHIYEIIKKMADKPSNKYGWMSKIISVNLIELLAYQTNDEFIKGKELADAYLQHTGPNEVSEDDRIKIVYKNIIGFCVGGVTQSNPIPTDDQDLRQCIYQCHQACFNTLVATLLATKAELRFFEGFIFKAKRALFGKLVDDSVPYEFPVFIDEASHKEGVISNRGQNKKAATILRSDESVNFFPVSGNLSGSSLAPEATSYDFTTSVTVANSEFYQRIFANAAQERETGSSSKNVTIYGDKLEWNEINKHECMFAYVECLKYMHTYQKKEDKTERTWPTLLAEMLTSSKIHENVKTFLVGGIINTPESLEPFAAKLVEPILQLVLTDCFGKVKLNHFVQDVIITMLSWKDSPGAKPKDELVSKIIKYIIEGITNEEIGKRKDVLNHALEILQCVVRYWAKTEENAAAPIPFVTIGLLRTGNPTEESFSLMLQVCLSVLTGGQLPSTNVMELMKMFSKSTNSKYKIVYITAAKCIGRLLLKIKEDAPTFLEEHLTATITKIENGVRTKPSVFVEVIIGIQSHFPEIMCSLKNRILELFQFPKIRSELLLLLPLLLRQELAVVRSGDEPLVISPTSTNCVDEFFTDIDSRGLCNQACKGDGDFSASLDLFETLIDNCSQPSRILKMVDWLESAETSTSTTVKASFANCLQKLYERLMTNAAMTNTPMDPLTKNIFLKKFIRMYADENDQVHENVNKFWTSVLRDWGQSADLLLELFDLIGKEEHPLVVLLGLILHRCCLSPDYSKYIFPEPLEQCEFVPFELDTSWRLRHSSFQPLFAESLSSVKNFGTLPRAIQSSLLSQRMTVGKFGMNVLRATLANLQFTPTQQQNSSDSLINDMNMEIDHETSFHFDSSNDRPPPRVVGSGQENSSAEGNHSLGSLNNPILKMRKKFYARKDSTFYATRQSEVRVERIEEAKEVVKTRVSGVRTVRKYRIGELPDILIHHSDVLNTLVKLAKQDENLGRQFLRLLFQAMVEWVSLQGDSRSRRKFLTRAKDIFEGVFRNTLESPDRSLTTLLMELSIVNSIKIPTNIVLEMSKACNLQVLGILKLEDGLLDESDSSTQSSKKSRTAFQGQELEHVWLGLAELYKEIEEYDVLRNIFDNLECSTIHEERKRIYNQIGGALHSEGMGNLAKAEKIYDSVLNTSSDEEISSTGKVFLQDSLMSCVSKLGNWDDLYQLTVRFIPDLMGVIFENKEFTERIMPLQMLSGMQLTLRHEGDDDPTESYNEFQKFLQTKLETEEGTSFLTSTYPFEIGTWLLIQDENEFAPQANLMLERGYEKISRLLQNAEILPLKLQKQIILLLQQSSVLNDYLKWRKDMTNSSSAPETQTYRLLTRWRKLLNHQPLELLGSYMTASYRDCFLSKIGVTLQELEARDTMLMSIQEQRVDQDIWLASLGSYHKSFPVSQNCLTRLIDTERYQIRPLEFQKSIATSLAVFPNMFEQKKWCEKWCGVWKKLGKASQEDVEVSFIKVDLLECLAGSLKSGKMNESTFSLFAKALGEASSATNLTSCLLTVSRRLVPDLSENVVYKDKPSFYSRLFALYKKLTDVIGHVDKENAEMMLSCILRGCTEKGDWNEMLLLSNIFSMVKQFSDLNQTFELLAPAVPSYLFLPWLDQIITAYKSFPKEYSCFKSLIGRLVMDFPQAFQLQYPEYLDEHCQLFGKALKAIVLPHKLHENMFEDLMIEKKEEKRISLLTEFQATLQNIINSSNVYGEIHVAYANPMFEVVNGVLLEAHKSSQGTNSSSGSLSEVSSQSWNTAKKEISTIHERCKTQEQRNRVMYLEKFSPFLANFHFFEHAPLEKPGLYEHFRKPNIQDHPLIVSFHPTVQYYISMTIPIKLTVITNDGKRVNFLAKKGDDLRQDRRIQQLFRMSNMLFQKNVYLNMKTKNLALDTYSCIPITANFGLIEMVENVVSLADVIFDTSDLQTKRGKVQQSYDLWMKQNSDLDRVPGKYSHYRSSASKVGRQPAESYFKQLVGAFPRCLLSNNIRRKCCSQMEFFCIRQTMIKSYGAMCMVHWLLGIGDRHLDNSLLSMSTGKLFGIDFGRAFGTSNYLIPIPEMIPFRLTPQLQQLMLPHSYKGIFRETCILTWNCLVDHSETILTVANVFIQEPSVDWMKFRQGSKSCQEKDDGGEVGVTTYQTFFPFEIMKRKLLCHNPTSLIIEELKIHNDKEIASIYCRIMEDGRILREQSSVSNEQFVDILLNLATDTNVLSRIYAGWSPWV